MDNKETKPDGVPEKADPTPDTDLHDLEVDGDDVKGGRKGGSTGSPFSGASPVSGG